MPNQNVASADRLLRVPNESAVIAN